MFSGKYHPRRLLRIGWNKKHKKRDRYKVKLAKNMPIEATPKFRRFRLWRRDNLRCKCPPETGYGVAYEWRRGDEKY